MPTLILLKAIASDIRTYAKKPCTQVQAKSLNLLKQVDRRHFLVCFLLTLALSQELEFLVGMRKS
jgi:hypothetical protein